MQKEKETFFEREMGKVKRETILKGKTDVFGYQLLNSIGLSLCHSLVRSPILFIIKRKNRRL